jgi:hypothetical protein
MIVMLSQLAGACSRHRIWLASLCAAAAINVGLFWLASLAPMGHLAKRDPDARAAPVEIVMRRRVPPPPDLDAMTTAESPPAALPPRFRPKLPVLQPFPGVGPENILPRPNLRLNLRPCDPADEDARVRPECAPSPNWQRADRDASELFGSETKGLTLDDYAHQQGWRTRKLPNQRLDSMTGQVDSTISETVFKDSPF